MSNSLMFLGIAVAIALVGGVIVTVTHRVRHVAPRTAADEFRQVMDALAPDADGAGHGIASSNRGAGPRRPSESEDGAPHGT